MQILLVEDELALARAIQRLLEANGQTVTVVPDGDQGLKEAKSGRYDLVILDVMLPGKNGFEILSTLRNGKHNVPVLMLTALDDTDHKVQGLESGADDYLAKPFENKELAARVSALLRRDKINKAGVITIHDLVIDRKAKQASRAEIPLVLTQREFELLEALALNQGKVLSRDTIQFRVWGDEESVSNTVDVFVASLRKKVDRLHDVKLIHTVVGFGYVLKVGGSE
ncbi:MAG: response regulator transcription factor [Fimbriimonadaceae bacterium]|jgi:two-component system copper resistance phosphate regulon response regulator CusR|nr:response regulator transcription factor [Fimbriimonadaceae bacterium]